ncbi:MAG: glycosyltransferase N-terminal domain-containing protein, partial [Planctomycetota bacterium]
MKTRQPAPLRFDPFPGIGRRLLHRAYGLAWWTAGAVCWPVILWKARRPAFRRMLVERLGRGVPRLDPTRRRILVHGVSVGEVKGAAALVAELERFDPGLEIAISTTTDTGQRVARGLYPGLTVVRFPFDVESSIARFLDRVRPTAVVLVELEIWPNFLRLCNQRGIPIVVVNGRITDRSHARYRRFRHLLPQFRRISYFAVQSEEYALRFLDLGVEPARLSVTGNIKFDALRLERREPAPELVRRVAARSGQPVVVAGSTHDPEERAVVAAWLAGAP